MSYTFSDINTIDDLTCKIESFIIGNNIGAELNLLIDEISSFTYRSSLNIPSEKIDLMVRNLCECLPINNSLLLAKCCQLLLNVDKKQKLLLSDSTLKLLVQHFNACLQSSADVSFIDILQLLKILIEKHQTYFSNEKVILKVLLSEIEKKSVLTDPIEVKILRLRCLSEVGPVLSEDEGILVSQYVLKLIYEQPTDHLFSHAKVWSSGLIVLDRILPLVKEYIESRINDLMGVIIYGLQLGIKGTIYQKPSPLFPSTFPNLPSDQASLQNKSLSMTKNWKQKVKKIELNDLKQLDVDRGSDSFYSDSDVSDQEKDDLSKEQSVVRLSSANFLINLLKVCDRKSVSGFYCTLLSSSGLQFCLKSDLFHHSRLASISALRALISSAKPLALAQHSDGRCSSFTAYSQELSDVLVSCHNCLSHLLAVQQSARHTGPLLQCFASLISVSPYHRLPQGIIRSTLVVIPSYINDKKANTVVAVLQCLNALVSSDPVTDELTDVLSKGPNSRQFTADNNWITSFCLKNIQVGDWNEAVRVGWWQLINCLFQKHFALTVDSVQQFLDLIVQDLGNYNYKTAQGYAFQALSSLLQQLAAADELRDLCSRVWKQLLDNNGPLIPHLQDVASPVAGLALLSINQLNQATFFDLSEKSQILLMTLLYGCCSHPESSVRTAAIGALGCFLVFPLFANEPYLFDIALILLKGTKDGCSLTRSRVAWALGNLADLLKQCNDPEAVDQISLTDLINACLTLSKDQLNQTKASVARALGSFLMLISEQNIEQLSYKELLDQSALFLTKSASSGGYMKLRWNACYGISNMLKNEHLYKHSSNWFENAVKCLCNLLIKCNHFKVRLSACAALCSVAKRSQFANFYLFVWQCLLDGLENSANMPDFKEFKHQRDLVHQICSSICHIISLIDESDIPPLASLLEFREDNLIVNLKEFLTTAPPDRTHHAVAALRNLCSLKNANQSCLVVNLIDALTL